jgi:hypothetical protein
MWINIEIIRTDPGDADLSPIIFLKRGPLFIFYDQEPLNFNYNKIPSALLTNFDLIKEVANERKKTYISTGGAN